MLHSANANSAEKLVAVNVVIPFRLKEGNAVRETKVGETVNVEYWLAVQLANHVPAKIGPVTERGRQAAEVAGGKRAA